MARIVKREDIVGKTRVKDMAEFMLKDTEYFFRIAEWTAQQLEKPAYQVAAAILVNAFTNMGELGVLVMNLCTVGELRDLMEKEAQEYIEAHPEDRI